MRNAEWNIRAVNHGWTVEIQSGVACRPYSPGSCHRTPKFPASQSPQPLSGLLGLGFNPEWDWQNVAAALNNLSAALLANSSANSNGVATMDWTLSDPPTAWELGTMFNTINALILALRRPA
ncbi:MAG: hypothetical protein WCO56_13770 [Verrucomicrobiota bacterium]